MDFELLFRNRMISVPFEVEYVEFGMLIPGIPLPEKSQKECCLKYQSWFRIDNSRTFPKCTVVLLWKDQCCNLWIRTSLFSTKNKVMQKKKEKYFFPLGNTSFHFHKILVFLFCLYSFNVSHRVKNELRHLTVQFWIRYITILEYKIAAYG